MTSIRAIAATLAALMIAMIVFETTSLDLALQDLFYDFQAGEWVVDEHAPGPRIVFYTGPKVAIILLAGALVAVALCDWRRHRRFTATSTTCLFLVLCLGIVPGAIAVLKEVTDVYCPAQVTRYGGKRTYHKLFEAACCGPAKRGQCFPAGHASGGFALLALAFVGRSARGRALGIVTGLGAGWAMGLYQMVCGNHYLSHTVATMLIAMLLCQTLARFMKIDRLERPPMPAAATALSAAIRR